MKLDAYFLRPRKTGSGSKIALIQKSEPVQIAVFESLTPLDDELASDDV